jgi:hypothetical protein
MKKMIFLFTVLLVISTQSKIFAQTDSDVVNFTAILEQLFAITVSSGPDQTATFTTADDYNLGVYEGAGISTGLSEVTMEALGNWNVQIDAADFFDGGSQYIPIENLGVWVEAIGNHQNNNEVLFTCTNAATSQGITNTPTNFIIYNSAGAGNGGDVTDNNFRLHWRMGTMDQGNPTQAMLNTSMFAQVLANDFGPGTYTTVVNLTMTAAP